MLNWTAISMLAGKLTCWIRLTRRKSSHPTISHSEVSRVLQTFSYLAPGLPVSVIQSLFFMILAMMYMQGAIEEAH